MLFKKQADSNSKEKWLNPSAAVQVYAGLNCSHNHSASIFTSLTSADYNISWQTSKKTKPASSMKKSSKLEEKAPAIAGENQL